MCNCSSKPQIAGVKAENLLDLDEDASPSMSPSTQEGFNSFTANSTAQKHAHVPSPSQSNPVDDLLGLFGNATVSNPDPSMNVENDIFSTNTTPTTQENKKNGGLEDLLF